MSNARKKSQSQRKRTKPNHLPKVGSDAQLKWDRRTRLGDLDFDMAWVAAAIGIIVVLAALAYFL
jgi:hypothetical protein